MDKKVIALILIFCFLPGAGHAANARIYSLKPLVQYNGTPADFFKDMDGGYKIAYQTKSYSTILSVPDAKFGRVDTFTAKNYERINIIMSDFNGTGMKNITESINPGENLAFLYPKWSPDGKNLAFFAIRYEREKSGTYTVYNDIYVTDENDSNLSRGHPRRGHPVRADS